MDIFAFSDVLNLCYCIIRDIVEVRICQTGSFKLNLTIRSSNSDMVTSNKVDFLIDSFDICTASLSRPEIASFNRVIDTINRQPRRSIRRSNSTDFRASCYVKSSFPIIIAEIDFDVFAIRTTTAGNRNATTYFVFAFILARCRVVLAAANEVDSAAISTAFRFSCRLDFFNRVAGYGFTVVIYLFQSLVELTNGHVR